MINNPLKKSSNHKGFTLIELLVTIAIIAVLSTVGVPVYTNAQKTARDGKRIADLNSIANSLETSRSMINNTTNVYSQITGSNFARGFVPTDSGNGLATYCVITKTDGSMPGKPTVWLNAAACPTVAAAEYVETIAPGTTPETCNVGTRPCPDANIVLTNTKTWMICNLLENGSNPGNINCTSSQP